MQLKNMMIILVVIQLDEVIFGWIIRLIDHFGVRPKIMSL